jgi:hypothetical protein
VHERRKAGQDRRLEEPRAEAAEQRERDRRLDAADKADADERDRTRDVGEDGAGAARPAVRRRAEDRPEERRRQEVREQDERDAPCRRQPVVSDQHERDIADARAERRLCMRHEEKPRMSLAAQHVDDRPHGPVCPEDCRATGRTR